ncbi:MAG: hypothetical protein IRZ16_17865 [Myxococcaceae bacterium]|nr:hypothetical protein [Myxococcaceae bacterium]
MAGINRIDPTGSPVRMSTNLSINRQTPKTDFGDRVKAGLDTAAGAVATGAAVAAPFVPGGAIVSAAVSSVTTMATSGQNPGAVATQYSAYSSVPSPVGYGTPGGINTTVGTGVPGQTPPIVAGTTSGGSIPGTVPGGGVSGGTMAGFNADLEAMRRTNLELMQAQMNMQRENQVFTTVSNVLKVRHDTVKNTIQNVR